MQYLDRKGGAPVNGCELTAYVTAAANALAANATTEQIELMAVVFTQLGDTLATIAVSRSVCKPACGCRRLSGSADRIE